MPLGAHRDAVADADRVEPHPDQTGRLHALLHLRGARSSRCMLQVLPSYHMLRDADLRTIHVLF
jgi:hypothetical protein